MPALTLTFLGTGTSQGVPTIGCDCEVCTSTDPHDKRLRSSIFVQTPEAAWVVDTGPDFRAQCLREKITQIDAVVYTHAHTDHIAGFDDLRPFCAGGREIPVYASDATMRDLQHMFEFAFNGTNRFPGYVIPNPFVVSEPFDLGKTTLFPLPVKHGRFEVFGYLFCRDGKKLAAYLSDCKEVPETTLTAMRGVRYLIIDALRHREHPTHMNISEALAISEKLQPEKTWFTHICHDLGHAETEAVLPPNVRLAFDGLKIDI